MRRPKIRGFKWYTLSLLLVLTGLLSFLFSCGGAGNDLANDLAQEYIKVMGTAKMLVKSRAITSDPTTANAIMPAWYYLGAWQFGDLVTADASGYFSVDLPADSDRCMLLLVDTTQPKKIDQIVGYVAIGVDASHNLLNFPASQASSDIDLGTISEDTDADQADEVKSDESKVDAIKANLNLTLDELKQMASNDNMLRSIKNWYANNHGDYWYGLNPVYILTVSGGIGLVNNTTVLPDDILDAANNIYYQLLWMPSNQEDNPGSLEFTGTEMSIYTPSDMTGTISAKDWDGILHAGIGAGARLSTNTSTNVDGARFWERNEDSSAVGEFLGAVPDGQWVVKKDDVEIARYEFSQQNPITYQSDGTTADHFNVFVPVIKINTTGDIVESIDIQWYLYDGSTSTYQPVDPTSKAFQNVVEWLYIDLADYNTTGVSESFEIGSSGGTVGGNLNITDTHIVPTEYKWTVGTASSGEVNLNSLAVQYEVYGTRFMFDYR